ncbi:hypothetical protein Tco_0412142, partial [Tanacetum coccineum]
MSTHKQETSTIPTSVVRNTGGKSGPQNLEELASNEALRELCDKNYHQLLPLIAEKMKKEKKQQDKLKASPEEGMGPSTPEARHQSPTSSKDSRKTDLLHLGSGRGRKEVCSLDWEEKNQARTHALIVTTRVSKQRELRHRVTTSFLQGEVTAFSHGRKKAPAPWKKPDGGNKPNFKKGLKNKHMPERKSGRFSLLTKTPKEIFALEKGKFKAPPPMVTPANKRDPNKYCEFHADMSHNTNECMQLRKQIDEMIKAGKLSQFIKELKQNDKPNAPKKGDTTGKERPLAILMIQPWEKVAKKKVTQSFSPETTISFPTLGDEDGTEGTMIIEAEIGGHFVHRIGETIWPLGQISLLVKIGDEGHSTSAWMNFIVVSSKIIPMECAMITGPSIRPPEAGKIFEQKIRVAIHPEYPEQTIAIGSTLTEKGRKELCTLLGQNLDVFSWKPADMTGIPRSIAEHCLNIREGCRPVKKKKRGQAPERNKAIQEKVEKLVDAGIMKEVHYHSWLS